MRKRDSKRMPSLESLVGRIRVTRAYEAMIDDVSEDEFPTAELYQSVWHTVEQASTPAEARRLYVAQLTRWHNRVTKWLRSTTEEEQRQISQ